ncbi:phage portal protein [Afifella sp. YEN Y35]|uniref:phage portal protein n=1 Tax=Afifella sp. YEN Y35 TaxID=3388337 RepID=UPI0039DF60FA
MNAMPSLLGISRQVRRQAKRAADKLLRRSSIEAGGTGRRWPHAGLRAPSSEILRRRQLAGARAAWLVANSPYAAAVLSAWVTNLIADGPSMRVTGVSKRRRTRLQSEFSVWWDVCDADGLSDLGGFLQRVARSEFVYGEAFVHLLADPETGALRLRLWSPEQIDPHLTRDLGNGVKIVAGIEIDAFGRRVAYHVRENADMPFATPYGTKRIPAEDVLHIFEPNFPGQMRGISRLAPVATRITEVDKLEDALVAKANTAALFGGVFYRPDGGGFGEALPAQGADGEYGMEPGAMIFAPPGYQVEFTEPPSTEGAVDFLRAEIRSIAAGVGMPYELVSGDLSQVNYSSARLGLLEFRRRIAALQRNLIIARFLLPVWRRFLLLEGLAGRIEMGVAMSAGAEFVFPGWAQIDPLKETQADAKAIEARLKSRFEVISARGRDPDVVDEEIRQDAAPPVQQKEAA